MALGADDGRDARGVAVADYDNDGDLDIAVNHNPGDNDFVERRNATLLRNQIGQRHGWLAIELRGTSSNRDAVGAVVTVATGGERQLRQVTAGSSYASQHGQRLYFGLGEGELAETVTISWPSGLEESFDDIAARQLLRVVEGEGFELVALGGGQDPSMPTVAQGMESTERPGG